MFSKLITFIFGLFGIKSTTTVAEITSGTTSTINKLQAHAETKLNECETHAAAAVKSSAAHLAAMDEYADASRIAGRIGAFLA